MFLYVEKGLKEEYTKVVNERGVCEADEWLKTMDRKKRVRKKSVKIMDADDNIEVDQFSISIINFHAFLHQIFLEFI